MASSFVAYFSGAEAASREKEALELVRVVETEMDASNGIAETQSCAMRAIVGDLEKIIGEMRDGVSQVSDGAGTATQSIGAVAAAVSQLHASSQEVGRQANEANVSCMTRSNAPKTPSGASAIWRPARRGSPKSSR